MIAIVDYGAGNLRSVAKAMERLGCQPRIITEPSELEESQAVILPGVGAAADAMQSLRGRGFVEPIRRWALADRPLFAVCLGLQLLFALSEEGGLHPCLNVLPGTVKRFPPGLKVPHMGWNQVHQKQAHFLFSGVPDGAHFYFVHSYYVESQNPSVVVGETDYQVLFPSVVASGSLVATQFHPEKSGTWGLKLYENFLRHHIHGNHPRH
jgi:glutamine amidotransferase